MAAQVALRRQNAANDGDIMDSESDDSSNRSANSSLVMRKTPPSVKQSRAQASELLEQHRISHKNLRKLREESHGKKRNVCSDSFDAPSEFSV